MTTNDNLPNEPVDQLANLVQSFPVAEGGLRTLALVSSNRGEGTSTCTVNLAKYLAGVCGARVLMIDANLRHPALHELTNVERETGLTELLAGEADLEAVVKRTQLPKLSVVTSGNGVNPNQLLDPARLQGLIRALAGYDFVLFDCPPVNLYLEATQVAGVCDGVILVVEGEKTRRQAALSAKAQLGRANCKLLGVFMNKRKFYIPKFLYDRL